MLGLLYILKLYCWFDFIVCSNSNRFILWIQKTTGLPVDERLWRRYDG